jgi:hypothetical protein
MRRFACSAVFPLALFAVLAVASPATAQVASTFELTVQPMDTTVIAGQTAVYTVSVTAVGAFSETVDLSCVNPPDGIPCEFSPASLAPGETSELTLVTPDSVPPFADAFQVVGTAPPDPINPGASVKSVLTFLNVTSAFTVAAAPTSQPVEPGGSARYTVGVAPVYSEFPFDEPVGLSCVDLPPGATCGFTPNQVIPGSTGQVSNLTLGTSATATPPGTYEILVRGTHVGGEFSRDATIELVVGTAADFTVDVDPPNKSVLVGQDPLFTVSVEGTGGFSDPVDLNCANLPADVSCIFNPPSVTPGSTSELRVVTEQTTPLSSYVLYVEGTSGSIKNSGSLGLTLTPSFNVSAVPSSQSVESGGGTTYLVTITPVAGAFDQPVRLFSIDPLPPGVNTWFDPNEVVPGSTGATSIFHVNTTDPDTPPGSYEITFRGRNDEADYNVNVPVNLEVGEVADFTVAVDPTNSPVIGGTYTTYTVSVAATNGFASPVDLSCGSLPADATCAFTPATVTPGSTAQLNVFTAQTTPVGTSAFEVIGTSGATTSAGVASLTVKPSFVVSTTPSSQLVEKGGSTTYSVLITPVNGSFDELVRLFCIDPLPAGVDCLFEPNQLTPGSAGTTSVLTVSTTDPDTPEGAHPIDVRGLFEDELYSRDATIELVVGTGDFTIAVEPELRAAPVTGTARYTVSVDGTGTAPVALTCGENLPAGVSCEFEPASVVPGGGANMTVTAVDAQPGQTSFSVTGMSSAGTDSETVDLVLQDFDISVIPEVDTVTAGDAAVYMIDVAPAGGGSFDFDVSFSCDGLPTGLACVFAPPTVNPGGQAAEVALTVAQGSGPRSIVRSGLEGGMIDPRRLTAPLALLFLAAAFAVARDRRQRRASGRTRVSAILSAATLILALAIPVALVSGCSDDDITGPAGPEIVEFTVTADGDGLVRTDQAVIAVVE